MKHLKTFENITQAPEIGDYVVLQDNTNYGIDTGDKFKIFINNNVGKLYSIVENVFNHDFGYHIIYSNIPDDITEFFNKIPNKNSNSGRDGVTTTWFIEDIVFFSKDKQNAETYIQSKKYNL